MGPGQWGGRAFGGPFCDHRIDITARMLLAEAITVGNFPTTQRDADRLGLERQAGVLPETVRAAFAPVADAVAAENYTRDLAHHHYENFSVVSALLPAFLRQDFCNVYAFCRIAFDLGDEIPDKAKALEALGNFREQLQQCYASEARTAVFMALRQTIRRHDIPMKPFNDLICAFEQDQRITRYQNFPQVVDYCTKSADPVGRIVLYMCGYRDEERQRLSDKTCTALQLINFWQDVRRDILERDRIYLPSEDMQRFGVTESQLRDGKITPEFRAMMKFQVERTETMFREGDALLPLLDPLYRPQIALFGKGGKAIAEAIRRQNFDTLTQRPRLSKWQKGRLVASTFLTYWASRIVPRKRRNAPASGGAHAR